MAYSMAICDQIERFLRDDDWKYRLDTDREVIKSGLSLKGKMKHVDILVDLREDKYFVYFTCPLNAGEDERAEVRDLLNRINYGIMFGNLEMDENDGEIRFRYAVDCNGMMPSQQAIKDSFYRPALTFMKYGDAIVQVIMGVATGQEAYERARED